MEEGGKFATGSSLELSKKSEGGSLPDNRVWQIRE
jgi:hypothetical protein